MSESLEKLRNRILSDARVKAENIIQEAQEKAEQITREAKSRAEQEANQILSQAKVEAEALKRSILSSRIRANRLRLLEEKNKIVQSILKNVEEELSGMAAGGRFEDTVKKLVTEGVDAIASERPIVRVGFPKVSERDVLRLGEILPKNATLVYDEKVSQDLGGVVVSDPNGKMTYKNTFRARLDRLDRQLFSVISSTIFGEGRTSHTE